MDAGTEVLTENTDKRLEIGLMPGLLSVPHPVMAGCADPLIPTIFHESWWLDIVTGGNFGIAEVSDNGAVVGRLPYYVKEHFGMRKCIMPPMTHFMGPAIIDRGGNPSTRFLRRAHITHELIHKLPPASIYSYKCHRDITDAVAFQQEQFRTSVQFTFEVAPEPAERIWMRMSSKKRKKIRAARDSMTITDIHDPMEFWRYYEANLLTKNVTNQYNQNICCKLIETCLARGQGRIYAARDEHREIAAAVFCIWDATASYYFMVTRKQEIHNGAVSLLVWEAMKDAASRGLIFDFDGLTTSNGVLFMTEFGGTMSPRYVVTRTTLAGGLVLGLSEMRRKSRFFY